MKGFWAKTNAATTKCGLNWSVDSIEKLKMNYTVVFIYTQLKKSL